MTIPDEQLAANANAGSSNHAAQAGCANRDGPDRRGRLGFAVGVQRRRRRRWLLLAVVILLAATGAGLAVNNVARSADSAGSGPRDDATSTSTATIARRSLSQTTPATGTLGYAGSYTVLAQLHGTITALPTPGRVIRQGGVLYRVDGYPVLLLYGSTPAYRTLARTTTAEDMTGADVAQLNHDLVTLGYLHRSEVDVAWDQFASATKAGIEKLQDHIGVDPTGELTLGQVVFLPTATRVTSVPARLGGPAAGPVLTASSTTRQISVDLDASLQSEISRGDRVTITLPDNTTTPGVVTSVGRVATSPASRGADGSSNTTPTVTVAIRPTRAADTGGLVQAPVLVAITERTVHDALVVPVTALLALAGGGYAVELTNRDGTHRLVSVSLGLFDDDHGLVQVTGSGLAAGEQVVVPAP